MRIIFHKKFVKRFKKLPLSLRAKVEERLALFLKNPHHPLLRNHSLSGALSTYRAFSITGDVRVIFQEQNNYLIVLLLDVGTHNQVY